MAGVTTDRLYPLRLSEEIAAARAGHRAVGRRVAHGHDGFLVETAQVGTVISSVLGAG